MPTLYELKQSLGMIGQQLKQKNEDLGKKATDPNVSMDDINQLKTEKEDLERRFQIVESQVKEIEQKEKSKVKDNTEGYTGLDDSEKLVKAKAEFYRHAILPNEFAKPSQEAQRLLHALPTGNESGGDKFLPKTLSKEIVSEPFAKNQLREKARLTNIKGLEIPRVSYTLDDDDFITDLETAKELELKGDTVKYGTNKFKVFAAISDTVIHGSDVDLVNWVENALASGLAAKERKDALAVAPKSGLEHMSFYNGKIKEVEGAGIYNAVVNALADLHEDYRENAVIYMRYSDYVSIIATLSNGTTNFFDTPAEKVFGKPVVFTDAAVKPIVGDFNYFGINYDNTTYDTDKDVKKGEYLFVLTAWYDQQRTLDSAFRIAKVVETP
ncbi:phage capsid protein [Mammaliicoccus sciuri]|uniref:phage major capsid protein n=1 Tax=Mammaliicoccus sciuri TaxID=1296 RepID=UPI00073416DD|nr:phage major capsid protein [Mammaliicoccus sciuri]KTT82723.1 phage capsid protein [Mammaliicoccus sciuri]KTT88220.1 phage capsid protein [Mammaliicoccus sciuri]KTT89763.1 phage capsid protein [Mammaliicoccus sciuri]KTT94155.1 phage capsid protein [Mammaliicoccus sciuri]KTW10739.1 phage capsid protein [Mammaliicoccus sciuri]